MSKKIKTSAIKGELQIPPKKSYAPKTTLTEKLYSGRPELYTEEMLENEAKALLDWVKKDDGFYLGEFALERGYTRYYFNRFCEKNEAFCLAYEKAKQWQEKKFLKNGLTKVWDPGFTQYVMARVCSPEWKKSFEGPSDNLGQPVQVTINKIVKA